jgi:hypothetical protein
MTNALAYYVLILITTVEMYLVQTAGFLAGVVAKALAYHSVAYITALKGLYRTSQPYFILHNPLFIAGAVTNALA